MITLAKTKQTDSAAPRSAGDWPAYIAGQMARARAAPDAEERSACLANALAANGLWLSGMGGETQAPAPDGSQIARVARGIRQSPGFRALMESGEGKALAEANDLDGLTRALRERELAQRREQPTRTALEVIRSAQARVRKNEAGPRDYAALIAAHRLASWEESAQGKNRSVTRRDLLRPVDAAALKAETERVENDPAFRDLLRSENPQNLKLNALRINGLAMTQYAGRAAELRRQEAESEAAEPKKSAPDQAPGLSTT